MLIIADFWDGTVVFKSEVFWDGTTMLKIEVF